jgi:glycosyltransferase involved in cell wall biosynthesis
LIRLLILIRRFDTGGAQRQLIALLRGLDKARFEVMVVSFYAGGDMAGELRSIPGVRSLSLDKASRWDLTRVLWRLRRLVKSFRPHVIYGYMGPSHLAALLLGRLRGARVVWAVRASNMDPAMEGWLGRVSFWLECRLASRADLIIANSDAGRQYAIEQGFPEEKTTVVLNGIDTARFHPDAAGRARLRAVWGLGPEVTLVGVVARLNPMKDHRNFLRAAARLTKRRNDLRFVCIGDGPEPYRSELAALGRDLGLERALIWAGAHADVTAAYSALDIAVNASAYGEGFSNVIGEAMACGVPCVVTDVGDSARIVGDAGEVVLPGDPEALAAGVTRLLDRFGGGDYAQVALRQAVNRERIRVSFSTDRLISETEALLLGLALPDGVPP